MSGEFNPRQFSGPASTPEFLTPLPPPLPTAPNWTYIQPPAPVRTSHHSDSQTDRWAGILVLSCLVIGILGGMLELERSRVKTERDHAMQLMTAVVISEARNEDLGKTLADPRTRLIHLESNTSFGISNASLAFNDSLNWGALLCDDLPPLPDGRQYEIWATASEATVQLATIQSQPGVSTYPFHFDSNNTKFDRVEITAGSRSTANTPLLSANVQ